jgi:Leucine Rich repeat
MMFAPHSNDRMERVRRAEQRWKALALSALFILVAIVLVSATLMVIDKRQQEKAQQADAAEHPGRRLEDEKSQGANRDRDYLQKKAPSEKQDPDVAALRKLGADIKRNRQLPDRPVVAVSLFGTRVGDGDLARLHDLAQVRDLCLAETNITDEGLAHLRGLTRLQKLDLRGTRITDKGLAYLRGLSELRDLDLFRTPVTDQGVQYLKGLLKLETLNLFRTQVTETGIKELQGALPAVKIEH